MADDFVWDFEWLEPNNKVEIVVGESKQLQYNCRTNKNKVFTSEYADDWIHYDFSPYQHVVATPTGYSIDKNGVITGLVAGSYAMKFTGMIQPKSGTDKWLYITVVKEKSETESNNTLNTANEFTNKIKVSLYNMSDVDYVKYKHNAKNGSRLKFKVHYEGYGSFPRGYKWATFSGYSPQQMGGGSLLDQDQECNCLVNGGEYIYFELYFNQSYSSYFNYGDTFTIEIVKDDTSDAIDAITNDKDNQGVRKYISDGKIYLEKNKRRYLIDGRQTK